MNPFAERRLIYRTLSDFGLSNDQKVTTRNADAIVAEQNRQRAQQMLTPKKQGQGIYIQPGVNAPVNYDIGGLQKNAGYNPETGTYSPIATIYNTPPPSSQPEGQGNIEKLRNLRLLGREGGVDKDGNVVDKGRGVYAATGEYSPIATDAQRKANAENLRGIANAGYGVSVKDKRIALSLEKQITDLQQPLSFQPWDNEEFKRLAESQRMQQLSEAQKQLSELQKRDLERKKFEADQLNRSQQPTQQPGAQPPASGDQPQPGQDQQQGAQLSDTERLLASIFQENPEIAEAYGAQLGSILDAEGAAKAELDATLKDIGKPDDEYYQTEKTNAREDFLDKLDFNDKIEDLARDRADENNRAALARIDRAEALETAEYAKQELDQIRKNTEDEIAGRRQINKLGGGHDYRGLHYVREQVQSGLDALNFIRTKASIMHGRYGDMAVEEINRYGLEMRQIDLDSLKNYDDAYDDYQGTLKELNKEHNLEKREIRKLRFEAHKAYSKRLTDLDIMKGEALRDARLKSLERVDRLDKEMRESSRDLFNQVFKYIDTYGTQNREQLSLFEQQLGLPRGSLSNQKTIEELRMRKTGGTGTGMFTGQGLQTYVEDKRKLLREKYPDKTGEQIDRMVINLISYEQGSSRTGVQTVSAVADYMTRNNIQKPQFAFYSSAFTGNPKDDYETPPNTPYAIIPERSPLVKISTDDGLTDEERAALGL